MIVPAFFADYLMFFANERPRAAPIIIENGPPTRFRQQASSARHRQNENPYAVQYNLDKYKILTDFDVDIKSFITTSKIVENTNDGIDPVTRIGSAITKRYGTLPIRNLKELINIQTAPDINVKNLDKLFHVKAYFIDIQPSKLFDMIKKYCRECRTM